MIEGATPNTLLRRGFTRDAVKAGTEITIVGYRAKNGANRANGRDLILPDGSRLFMSSPGTGAPDEGEAGAERAEPSSRDRMRKVLSVALVIVAASGRRPARFSTRATRRPRCRRSPRPSLGSGAPWVVKLHAQWCPVCMLTKGMWSEIEETYAGRVRLAVFDFTDEATTRRAAPKPSGSGSARFEEAGFATGSISCSTAAQGDPRVDQRQPRLRRVSGRHRLGPRRGRSNGRSEDSMRAFVAATPLLCAPLSLPRPFPPGYVDPGAAARGRRARDRRSQPEVHHVLGHRLRRRGRPDVRERRQHRLAAHRLAGQLHAHHQLGGRHEQGDVRPQAGLEPGVVEVRTGLAGRHADAEGDRVRRTSSTAATPGTSTATARPWPCRRSWRSCISWTCG